MITPPLLSEMEAFEICISCMDLPLFSPRLLRLTYFRRVLGDGAGEQADAQYHVPSMKGWPLNYVFYYRTPGKLGST
jgi:hypothetical protein